MSLKNNFIILKIHIFRFSDIQNFKLFKNKEKEIETHFQSQYFSYKIQQLINKQTWLKYFNKQIQLTVNLKITLNSKTKAYQNQSIHIYILF